MFKILDRYIIKKMLTTFFFVVLVLVSIICVIDYTEKNSDFMKHHLTFGFIFKEYFIHFIPYMANMLSPITVFIATVFVTAQLAGHTEIIAMLNSGMSFRRLMLPYLLASSILGVGIFILGAWVIPQANKQRLEFENKYYKDQFYYDARNVHIKIAPKSYIYLESYNNTAHIGYQCTIETIDSNKVYDKIKSDRIVWIDSLKKWRLENYTFRSFANNKEILKKGVALDTSIDLSAKDFESQYMMHEQMTIDELDKHINKLKLRGAENIESFLIEKYERFTYPFAIIILTMIGVIVSARKSRGGTALQISLGFILAFVYIIFVIMSRSITSGGGLHPLLGAWVPNIVFTFIGGILYKTVPR